MFASYYTTHVENMMGADLGSEIMQIETMAWTSNK
jgi:hypothetical protein